jgi:hypothetical protein
MAGVLASPRKHKLSLTENGEPTNRELVFLFCCARPMVRREE